MALSYRVLTALPLSFALGCSNLSPPIATVQGGTDIQNVAVGQEVRLDASASSDPQNRELSFEWSFTELPKGSKATLNQPRSKSPTFLADVDGLYVLRLVVSNSVLSTIVEVRVTVGNCGGNRPVASIATSSTQLAIGAPIQVQANVTDADNLAACNRAQTFTYAWSLQALPAGSRASLNTAVAVNPSFTPDVDGDYTLRLEVTDSTGLTSAPAFKTISVKACGNNRPSATIGEPAAAQVGAPVRLSANVSDADTGAGCGLVESFSYSWTLLALPQGSSAQIDEPAARSPAFTPDVPGDYAVELVVTDHAGLASAPAFSHVVAAGCAAAPIAWEAKAITATVTDRGAPAFTDGNGNPTPHVGALVQLSAHATVSDYCGSFATKPLTFAWAITERPEDSGTHLDSAAASSPAFRVDKNGHYRVSVIAKDARGNLSTPQTIDLDTTTCGINPVATRLLTSSGSELVTTPDSRMSVASFAPFFIGAEIVTDDNVAERCPARFHVNGEFTYSLAIEPSSGAGTLTNLFGDSTRFEAHVAGAYAVDVDGAVTNLSGRVHALPAFAYFRAAPCDAPVLSNGRFTVGGKTVAAAFNGDRVDLAVNTTYGNCGAISTAVTYSWTLSANAPSAASLAGATSATPSFTADVFGGSYAATVTAIDAQGNRSEPVSVTIAVSKCGANPLFADFRDTSGMRAFDDHAFEAIFVTGRTTFTDDDDPTQCPTRFAHQYSFEWSVPSSAPYTGYVFDRRNGPIVHFTPGGNAVFNVKLVLSAPGRQTEVLKQVAASCPDLMPKTGPLSLAGPSDATYPGKFFRDDVAKLSAAPTSVCFSAGSTAYSHLWTLTPPSGSHSVLSSTTADTPAFLADVPHGTWTASVIVVDKLGNRSTESFASFQSEKCGINPVNVSLTDTVLSPAAFDPHDLLATASSDDDVLGTCPARFRNPAYTFASSVTPMPPTSRWRLTQLPSAPTSFAARFEAGANGSYTIEVTATGNTNHLSATSSKTIAVNCPEPQIVTTAVAISAILDPDGVAAPPRIFRDERVTIASMPSSGCYSSGNFHPSFHWRFGPGTSDLLASFDSDAAASPTFVVNKPGATYEVEVEVRDQWNNGPATASRTFTAETCGENPVVVNFPPPVQASGTLPFDPWTATADASSADDDLTSCPQARFHQSYSITKWEVTAAPAGAAYTLSATSGAQTTFREGGSASGAYTLRATATASKSNLSSSDTRTIATAACASSGPTFTLENATASAIGVTASPPSPDDFYLTHPEDFFNGDTVNLSAPATFSCYTSQSEAGTRIAWSTTQAPSIAFVPNAESASPTFVADGPSKTWHLRVDVRDHWGHTDFRALDITSGICGAAPISAGIVVAQTADSKPMDHWTLTAKSLASNDVFSDDADPAKCPVRFKPTYTFEWSASVPTALDGGAATDAGAATADGGTMPPAVFSSTSSNPTTFAPAEPRAYSIQVVVSGNGQSGAASQTVDATCSPPSVGAPTFTNLTTSGSTVFKLDVVKLAATAITSSCFRGPRLTYAWTLDRNNSDATTLLSSAAVARPTFTAQDFGDSYRFLVAVGDGSGQLGTSPEGTLTVSSCGSWQAPSASYTATQRLDPIERKVAGAATSTSARLDVTQNTVPPTPTAVVDVNGVSTTFEVPFYLNTPIAMAVNVSVALCDVVTFNSAELFDPDFVEVPASEWTKPAAQTIGPTTALPFSFTPMLGDHIVNGNNFPGLYRLRLNLSFGGAASRVTTDSLLPPVNVAGRCGLDKPVADGLLTSGLDGTVTADGTASSDEDRETLFLDPSSTPGTSTHCGLDQTLSYHWELTSAPPGSAATLSTPDPAIAHFTPDVVGGYDLLLTVKDSTTPTPLEGSKAFHYHADGSVAFVTVPPSGTAGLPLAGEITTTIRFANGTICTSCSGDMTLSIFSYEGPGTTPTISGESRKAVVDGVATFPADTITLSPAGTYVLAADFPGAARGTSTNIVIAVPPAPPPAISAARR